MKRRFDDGGKGGKGEPRPKRGGTGHVDVSMPCVLKFQTPEVLASAVIGKGGHVIAAMRQACGAKISLTEHGEFYPGTDSRVLTAQANDEEALAEVSRQIISKLCECCATAPSESMGEPGDMRLRTMMPKAAVGGLIGKGGVSIKHLREVTRAKISISEPMGPGPGGEQVVSIIGTPEGIEEVMMEANRQVQAVSNEEWFHPWACNPGIASGGGKGLANDPWSAPTRYHDPGSTSTRYHDPGSTSMRHQSSHPMGDMDSSSRNGPGYTPTRDQSSHSASPMESLIQVGQSLPPYVMEDNRGFALSCVVPNRLVGGIIGRGGAGTKEVQSMTGTKITIREIPGDAENRSLNIAGPLADTCSAYMLMMKRYLDSEAQSNGPPAAQY